MRCLICSNCAGDYTNPDMTAPETVVRFKPIPSARKLENRFYRRASYLSRATIESLGPARRKIFEFIASDSALVPFFQLFVVLGGSRTTLARHLTALVESGLVHQIPAQAEIVVTKNL